MRDRNRERREVGSCKYYARRLKLPTTVGTLTLCDLVSGIKDKLGNSKQHTLCSAGPTRHHKGAQEPDTMNDDTIVCVLLNKTDLIE